MKKKILFIVFLIVAGISLFYVDQKFSHAKLQPYYQVNPSATNDFKIGIIGDSWVANQILDSLLQKKLWDQSIRVKIISSGNPGAMTSEIYENMFKNKTEPFSSKFIIEQKPAFCIVIAGVNDSARHIGKEFYAEHLSRIIQTLLHYDITPIVVKLPKFGLEQDFENKNLLSKSVNYVSEYISNDGLIENTDSYRKEFEKKIQKEGLGNKFIYFDFDKVSPDYKVTRKLYKDPMHLNHEGYEVFSEKLVQEIQNKLKQN